MDNGDFREWHYLRPLTSTTVPQSIMIVDTETYAVRDGRKKGRQRHHLRLWCAEACRLEKGTETRVEARSGTDADTFWQFVTERADSKRPLWVFCHNAGFDMTVLKLWQLASDGEIEFIQRDRKAQGSGRSATKANWCGIAVLDDPPTILKFRMAGTTKTVIVVDTFNYFRTSLKDLGETIGVSKGTLPPADCPLAVLEDYCRQDVTVLKNAVLSLIKLVIREGLGGLAYTVSGLAMNAYRKRFMPKDTPILIHGNKDAINLERQSYHGGSCHVWYLGYVIDMAKTGSYSPVVPDNVPAVLGPVYHLDAQSFYPSIMRDEWFPCRLSRVILAPSWAQLESALESRGVIADVQLCCPEPGFPVTRDGKTYSACGKINTVLPYPELARAMREGSIQKVRALARYEMAPLFKDFVDYFWKLRIQYRDANEPAFAAACKLILNSLYGKFGSYRQRWTEDSTTVAPVPFGNWYERSPNAAETKVYRSLGWLPQQQNGKAEHPDSFPAIASYVTSYGRERILKYANVAGIENCYYSDTDSLHVNPTGKAKLTYALMICKGKLGALDIKDVWPWAVYRGPKNYTTPEGDVIAGIKASAMKEASGDYRQQKFQRLASVLQGGRLDSIAVEDVLVRAAKYYPLGHVGNYGRVATVLLNEW